MGIEPSETVLALDKCLFDETVEGVGVELVYVFGGDVALFEKVVKALGRPRAGSSFFGRLEVLLIFPLLLAGLEVDGQTFGSEPEWHNFYYLPQI